MVLVTVRLPRGATLESALRRLDLSEEDVDTGYGLVSLDPGAGLYALRVADSAARKLDRGDDQGGTAEGVYSDPRIEPFGPPQ